MSSSNSNACAPPTALREPLRHLFRARTNARHTCGALDEEKKRIESNPLFPLYDFTKNHTTWLTWFGLLSLWTHSQLGATKMYAVVGCASLAAACMGRVNPITFRHTRVDAALTRWKAIKTEAEKMQCTIDTAHQTPDFNWGKFLPTALRDIEYTSSERRYVHPDESCHTDDACYETACNELRQWEQNERVRLNDTYGTSIQEENHPSSARESK